ncbi:uncharacterized protein LOC133726849 [Rosa rugosa]|uniref:uncharacterized protein LOC133726849 n=1 Tax=Rosa rugosa TaxID=74645 RepID=UPI002B4018E0|nr:uncharacterized protein LOC133726849 [Rosa rugosa]
MARLRQALVDCELIDMGFVGPRFTWSNRFTKERLDRACQNVQWRELYPFSRCITLPLSRFDHCPLLIEMYPEPAILIRTPKLFRFEEMWLQHTDCMKVVQQGWMLPTIGEPMMQVGRKIKQTGQLLLRWHSGVFQQRQTEMKLIQGKLDDLMKQSFEPGYFEVQKALQFRLNELLSANEMYWRQRSRVQWLKDGDHNMAFFHRRASNRRCRNRVKGLLNDEGQWTVDQGEVNELIIQYYEAIFRAGGSDPAAA